MLCHGLLSFTLLLLTSVSHGAPVPFPSFSALPPAVVGRADGAKYEVEFSWGTRRPVVEAPIGEPVDNSPVLVLAPKRTYRKDPLNDFKRYTGGWNISDRHYWAYKYFSLQFVEDDKLLALISDIDMRMIVMRHAVGMNNSLAQANDSSNQNKITALHLLAGDEKSVGFTAAPLFAIAAVWFLVFGLCLLFGCLCHFCCKRQRFGYSRTAYTLSLIFLILFSICAIIGCVVLYTSQERFHKSTTETLEYVVNQADATVDKLRAVSDFIASAKLVGVDQVFLPSNVQTDIDQIGTRINSSASVLADKTVDNSENIKDLLDSVRVALITAAAIMLLLTFLGFLFSIFRHAVPGVHPGHRWMDSCCWDIHFVWHIPSSPQVSYMLLTMLIGPVADVLLCKSICVAGDTCVAMDHWVQNPTAHTALDDILPCVDQATTQDTLIKSKEITSQLVEVVNQVITNVSNLNFSPNFKPMYINQSGPLVPMLCNPFYADLTIRPCSAGEVELTNATQVWSSYVCQVSANRDMFYDRTFDPCILQPNVSCSEFMLSLIFWVIYGRERRHRVYSKQLVSESAQGAEREKRS
ncbi:TRANSMEMBRANE PROTEIN [Salix viminalis]|uniref:TRANSMEMBRANE PROTEIN n=1 Tax=Salix viminalis TaxID=40686 RepID=A0A9Q0NQF3_SALVM|nr:TRANSMEMBRANE PROTEIN [Salix viminalis]